MQGSSTPKRQYGYGDDDGTWSEDAESFSPKRNRLEPPPATHWGPLSRASSQSSGGRSPSPQVRILGRNDVDAFDSLEAIGTSNGPLPTPPVLPQVTVQNPDLSTRSFASVTTDDQICFGMLKDIQIRINCTVNGSAVALNETQGWDGTVFTSLELVVGEDRCDIVAAGLSVATMNRRTHLALKSVASQALHYEGIMPRQDLQQKLAAAELPPGTSPANLSCTMAIILSGPRSISEPVAKCLSKYHLFLQHPNPKPPGMEYENPQYLSMVGSWLPNGAVLAPIPTDSFNQDTNRRSNRDQEDEVDLKTIMDNLPQPAYLREADIDGRIKAALLRHQKEALGFIMSRETTQDASLRSLWRLDSYVSGSPVYKHRITGSKSAKPKDTLGGILADGMGLGKTLTMISRIVADLPRAEFAARGPSGDNTKTLLVPTKATLVVVPSVLLLDGWIDEINKHVIPGTLACYRYHGSGRMLPSSGPLPYHVVISTYGTIVADFSRGGGVLGYFHWYRLVLDEAHLVRNWSTKQFSAVTALSAAHRWCMTGTPIQNSLDDLGALIRFLHVPQLEDAATFQKHVAGRRTAGRVTRPNYGNLKLLLGSICLRRSTSTILSSLGVTFVEHRPSFSAAERRTYDELAISCEESIKAAVNSRYTKRNSKSILTAMLRLRIFCNTGLASPVASNLDDDVEEHFRPDEVISLLLQSGEAMCFKCNTEIVTPDVGDEREGKEGSSRRRLRCLACSQGDANIDESAGPAILDGDPMEDVQMGGGQVSTSDGSESASGREPYPSKLVALLADIKEHYSQDKSIIFSFWRRSLDLVGKLFSEEGIVFGRVDGDVEPRRRQKILAEFHESPSVRVLLMTIGTGAMGLNNLSVASRVHILEPQWNPYVEDQAIGRVFRMGQSKNVCVVRYMMQTTIEEIIESRQMFKVQLALNGGLQSSDQEHSEIKRRVAHLQEFEKIIGSTILSRGMSDETLFR